MKNLVRMWCNRSPSSSSQNFWTRARSKRSHQSRFRMETSLVVIRFGPYELRRDSRELYKFGTKIKLRPQPFQVLSLLLSYAGHVVTREQLQQQLWPVDTFVDFEHSLNTAIKELRAVLNDSAAQPRYIETIPKLGYRFIFPVEENTLEAKPGHVAEPKRISTEVPAARRGTSRPQWAGLYVVAAVLLLGISVAVVGKGM